VQRARHRERLFQLPARDRRAGVYSAPGDSAVRAASRVMSGRGTNAPSRSISLHDRRRVRWPKNAQCVGVGHELRGTEVTRPHC
jgi:hypothetical protein